MDGLSQLKESSKFEWFESVESKSRWFESESSKFERFESIDQICSWVSWKNHSNFDDLKLSFKFGS